MSHEKVLTTKCPNCRCDLSEGHLDTLERGLEVSELLGCFVNPVGKQDYLCPECFDLYHLGKLENEGCMV